MNHIFDNLNLIVYLFIKLIKKFMYLSVRGNFIAHCTTVNCLLII